MDEQSDAVYTLIRLYHKVSIKLLIYNVYKYDYLIEKNYNEHKCYKDFRPKNGWTQLNRDSVDQVRSWWCMQPLYQLYTSSNCFDTKGSVYQFRFLNRFTACKLLKWIQFATILQLDIFRTWFLDDFLNLSEWVQFVIFIWVSNGWNMREMNPFYVEFSEI